MLEDNSYGYNDKAEEILEQIRKSTRGIEYNPLVNRVDYSTSTVDPIVKYLLGKGEIVMEGGGGPGTPRRFFQTPNKEFLVESHKNDDIVKQVRQKMNQIKEEAGEGRKYRVILQQVE